MKKRVIATTLVAAMLIKRIMTNHLFSVFQDERFMDLTIYQYGYEKCEPLHSFGPYVRNNYLVHYVISGIYHNVSTLQQFLFNLVLR